MAIEEARHGLKERLDDIIKLSQSGQSVQLEIKTYKNIVKQVSRSESTDDIDIASDMCLLMADFTSVQGVKGKSEMVTKVYAICPINENEIDAKTTNRVANQRLKMDYARLKEASVSFEEKYF